MARGKAAEVGDTMVSANGYHYTRLENGWKLTHHIIAEKKYGRPIAQGERVTFIDGKRRNLDPSNIEIKDVGRGSLRRRRAQLQARLEEIQSQIAEIDKELLGSFGAESSSTN